MHKKSDILNGTLLEKLIHLRLGQCMIWGVKESVAADFTCERTRKIPFAREYWMSIPHQAFQTMYSAMHVKQTRAGVELAPLTVYFFVRHHAVDFMDRSSEGTKPNFFRVGNKLRSRLFPLLWHF